MIRPGHFFFNSNAQAFSLCNLYSNTLNCEIQFGLKYKIAFLIYLLLKIYGFRLMVSACFNQTIPPTANFFFNLSFLLQSYVYEY